jgi:hypothetical protein
MKRKPLVLLMLPLFVAVTCRSIGVSAGAILQEEIIALEKRGEDAAARQDVKTAESLLAPEYTVTHTNGTVDSREQILASIGAGRFRGWVFEIEAPVVVMYGNVAILRGIRVVHVGENTRRVRFTKVYARRHGRWQAVSYQATNIQAQ